MSEFKRNICLMGYSGHAYVVAETLNLCGYSSVRYADYQKSENDPFSLNYAGFEKDQNFPWYLFDYFALGVGDNKQRVNIANLIRQQSKSLLTIIHPEALVSKYTSIDDGTFIARGACINPLVKIGKDVIINTAAVIEHECLIASGAHIAPGAILAGNVTIGQQTFIGANAVVKQGVSIGNQVVVGAGAVVIKNINHNTTVVGNPAKNISL